MFVDPPSSELTGKIIGAGTKAINFNVPKLLDGVKREMNGRYAGPPQTR